MIIELESPSTRAKILFQISIDLGFKSGFMSKIGSFEVRQFELVSKIEGDKHNNGKFHEKHDFTDRQSDLTNASGRVQAHLSCWA